jgi:hypothetical protein
MGRASDRGRARGHAGDRVRPQRPVFLLVALALALLAAACGGTTSATSPASLTVLPRRAVPYLASSVKPLTARSLAREAGTPSLERDLRAWGFQAGSERYFQGESRRLQVVDSRMLRFGSIIGASAFVRFVTAHSSPYLGSFASVRAFSVDGRRGKLLIAQPCQCHLANPALLGLVPNGAAVHWLEINGPGATRGALVRLMAQVI